MILMELASIKPIFYEIHFNVGGSTNPIFFFKSNTDSFVCTPFDLPCDTLTFY